MLPTIRAFMAAHQLDRRHRRRRRRDDLRRATSRRSRPPGCRSSSARRSPTSPTSCSSGGASTPTQQIPDGLILTQPWPAGPARPAPRPGHLLPVPGRPGPPHACAASTSRSPRPNAPSPGRRRSSATGSSASSAPTRASTATLEAKARALAGWKGYITNLATCPDGTRSPGVRDRRLPPAVRRSRSLVPHVQARPARPADLPPQTRVDRGAPERSCSPRSRSADSIEDRTGWSITPVRAHRPPLPHRPDPRRPAHSSPPKTHSPPTYATRSR